MVSYLLQFFFYNNQITKLQNRFKTMYAKVDPSQAARVKKMKNFSSVRKYAINKLQGDINQNQFAIDEFTMAMSGSGSIMALKDISQSISDDIELNVTLYDYIENVDLTGKVILKGETDGYGSVSKIKESLSKLTSLENVTEKSGSKPGSDGKVIEFTINADYVPQKPYW